MFAWLWLKVLLQFEPETPPRNPWFVVCFIINLLLTIRYANMDIEILNYTIQSCFSFKMRTRLIQTLQSWKTDNSQVQSILLILPILLLFIPNQVRWEIYPTLCRAGINVTVVIEASILQYSISSLPWLVVTSLLIYKALTIDIPDRQSWQSHIMCTDIKPTVHRRLVWGSFIQQLGPSAKYHGNLVKHYHTFGALYMLSSAELLWDVENTCIHEVTWIAVKPSWLLSPTQLI